MAGNYLDPPGARLAYDRDGTQIFAGGSNSFDVLPGALPTAEIKAMNDESTVSYADGASVSSSGNMFILFPSKRDITHAHFEAYNWSGHVWEWSANTTNGVDGTWTGFTMPIQSTSQLAMRQDIPAVPLTGVKALRWRQGNGGCRTYTLHLYGKPTVPGDRLVFWHPTLDQPLRDTPAHLDWGDKPRGSSETRYVRVKNVSASLTANGATVGIEALTDTTPSAVSQHQLVYQNGTPGSIVSLGNMAPGQISGLIEVRQAWLQTAILGLWSQRLYATATGWV